MKVYPKVPHLNDSSRLPDGFLDGIGYIIEKVDGGNARFYLYDERYKEVYPKETVEEWGLEDGDVVLCSKGTTVGVVGKHEPQRGEFENAYELVGTLDVETLRQIHDEYNSPVVYFAENMVYHSLDYGYLETPPPALLGFDVCIIRETDSLQRPANPYEQQFDGFLNYPQAVELFNRIGIEPVEKTVTPVDLATIDFDEWEFEESAYGGVISEGVVIRNPSVKYRAKLVREEFEEINSGAWGWNESEADTGEELFVARFCPQPRIEKTLNKMVMDEGREISEDIVPELTDRVWEDIWEEARPEIKNANFEFVPSAAKPLVSQLCSEHVRRKIVNAKLNDTDPTETFKTPGT